jgi:hypothetical protein
VTVLVEGPVAAVAFELDGKSAGRVGSPPWSLPVDFGPDYAPHELVARGLDPKGREVAVVRQWINLPRAPAEVQIVLERDAAGVPVAARLNWASLTGPKPEKLILSFDGRALAIDENRRAKLPRFDPSLPHVISALLEFPDEIRSRTDLAVGGGAEDDAGSELTAVPVRFTAESLPAPEGLRGRFLRQGSPLAVHAVEHGLGEVVIVRDPEVDREASRHYFGLAHIRLPTDRTELDPGDRLRILWAVTKTVVDVDATHSLFASTPCSPETGVAKLLWKFSFLAPENSPRLFADAVAVAGLRASGSGGRRAVVLFLGAFGHDSSRTEPAMVRRYLEALHVPLRVWSLAGGGSNVPAAAWGSFEDVSTERDLKAAVERLRVEMRSQSIVWLEGRHLPQQITVSNGSLGVQIVR